MTAKRSKLHPDPENQNDDQPSRIQRCKGALTAPTLATFLGMSRTTIYEMAATNRLPYYRIGCMVRFDPVTIAEWLRSQSVEASK